MSNSIVSQETSDLPTEASNTENSNTEGFNHNANPDSLSINDHTYHKHSAPKDVIYYRCSDKRCPARVHYNPQTKNFTMKNNHLNPKMHKKPSSQKTISSEDLIRLSNAPARGPLIISKPNAPQELRCNEELSIPMKRQKVDALLDSGEDKIYLVQFKVGNAKEFKRFSRILSDNCLATNVSCYSRAKSFTKQRNERILEKVIEVYTSTHFMGKVLLHIINYFGRGVEILFFQKDN